MPRQRKQLDGGASWLSNLGKTVSSVGNQAVSGVKSVRKATAPIVSEISKEVAPIAIDLATDAAKSYVASKGNGIRTRKLGGMTTTSASHHIPVMLTRKQIGTLKRGGAITISPSMVKDTAQQVLALLPQQAKKVISSIGNNKGVRVALKAGEDLLDRVSGGSLMDSAVPIIKALAPVLIDAVGKSAKKRVGKGSSYSSPAYSQAMEGYNSGMGVMPPTHRVGRGMMPLDAPIQIGSPYQNIGSPAMNPFFDNTGIQAYNPIPSAPFGTGGSGIQPAGVRGGYGIAPAGSYSVGMGTKKGMMRRTARRAYEGGKVDIGNVLSTAAQFAPLLALL